MADGPWWREIFDEDYLKAYGRQLDADRTEREAGALWELLGLEAGARLLDLCCGQGRHSALWAARGARVAGLDLSAPLLRAAPEAGGFDRVRADMREVPFHDASFDAACSFFTAFGYFEDEEENWRVLREAARVLRPGGAFLIEVMNRDSHLPGTGMHPRWWTEGEGVLMLDEIAFLPGTSRIENRRTLRFEDGRRREERFSVRAYSAHELRTALLAAGFGDPEIFGSILEREEPFHPTRSRRLVLLAHREG
jgi:SAM-dependent methyltransferase